MGLLSQRALASALVIGALCIGGIGSVACGSTLTNVGSIGSDDGDGAIANDAAASREGSSSNDATTGDATGSDGHADCTASQCVDVEAGVLCEGANGHRLCPDGHSVEGCACGGTAPSHWVNCGGCP